MTLERFERTELTALLALLKEQLEAGVESCMLPGQAEPREQYRDIVNHDRDTIAVVEQWIARLAPSAAGPVPKPEQCDVFYGGYQSTPIRCALPAGHTVKPDSPRHIHAGFADDGQLVTFGPPISWEAPRG